MIIRPEFDFWQRIKVFNVYYKIILNIYYVSFLLGLSIYCVFIIDLYVSNVMETKISMIVVLWKKPQHIQYYIYIYFMHLHCASFFCFRIYILYVYCTLLFVPWQHYMLLFSVCSFLHKIVWFFLCVPVQYGMVLLIRSRRHAVVHVFPYVRVCKNHLRFSICLPADMS